MEGGEGEGEGEMEKREGGGNGGGGERGGEGRRDNGVKGREEVRGEDSDRQADHIIRREVHSTIQVAPMHS